MRSKRRIYWVLGLMLLAVSARAEVADSLSVTVDEEEWSGGLDITIITGETGLEALEADTQRTPQVVTDLSGRVLRRADTPQKALEGLPRGIYLLNRRKVLVKG